MIDTRRLEKILKKKKDKIAILCEVLRITGNLCKIDDDAFDKLVNTALSKVENLLFLQSQSKKTTGQILTASDYRQLGIFHNHIKKLKRKSKKSQKKDKLIKLMQKLFLIKQERNLNYAELQEYMQKRYKISISRTYFIKIYKQVNS